MAKIAISLPEEILREVEKRRLESGESRSEFMRRALDAFFRQERERSEVEAYIRGYLDQPETEEELGWLEGLSGGVLDEYPWEEEPPR